MEVLRIIAMLCNLSSGVSGKWTIPLLAKEQAACHTYYAQCFDKKRISLPGTHSTLLLECVRDRK